ncbi:MAG: DUF2157 domain-containing protein [Chloroflexi bacterium]|nr:DUF2157 domain-containing protein [Chloroflexota bacterium]
MDDETYVERLAHDVAVWQHEGLISAEQERAILSRIGAGEPRLVGALRMGWLVTAVSLIGALVLAGGVVLLFASQWREMPDWFRTAVVFAGMFAAYAGGYLLTYRYGMDRIGGALLLLGVLLFEAGLFLFADIYGLPLTTANDEQPAPQYFLLAAIGTLPLAYAFGSRIVLLFGIGNFVISVIFWLIARYAETEKADSVLIVIGVLGVALYAAGHLHAMRAAWEKFGEVYLFVGTVVTLALVYVFTFDEPWRSIIDDGIESYAAPAVVYVSIAIAAALVAAQFATRARDLEADIETGILAALLAVAAVVSTWPAWTGYAVVFNAVFFAAAAGIVTRGYLRGDERYVNFGLLLVAVGVLTRYVDVFWSLLTNSAFFIIGGVLLLAVAFGLERLRRTLVARMDEEASTGDTRARAPALHSGAP